MIHHSPDTPDPRATFPPIQSTTPDREAWNGDFRIEIYPRADGDWGWRPVSRHNGRNLVPEGYRNRGEMIELLKRLFPFAEIGPANQVAAPEVP